jgi:iron-sulfur cluster assembly protein
LITVTPRAAAQIRNAATQGAAEELGLRLAAKQSADGLVGYGMGFDEERENDERVETAGVTLLISPLSRALLEDVVLDFVELEPGDLRFIFIPSGGQPDPESCTSTSAAGAGCGGCQGACG